MTFKNILTATAHLTGSTTKAQMNKNIQTFFVIFAVIAVGYWLFSDPVANDASASRTSKQNTANIIAHKNQPPSLKNQ